MKKRKFILLVLSIIILIFFCSRLLKIFSEKASTTYEGTSSPSYSIIKQDINKNYSGIGQEKISNKDGYFTTFTTTNDNKKTYKEYKQNGKASWSKNKYWNNTMAESGCGITALSIILSGYNINYTPEDLRKKYYPVLSSNEISSELSNTFGIPNSNFYFDNSHLSKNYINKQLKKNRPILICVWNKPNKNRWTTASHYMVLLASDEHNMVYISNPNGLDNTAKSSGWYNIDEVLPYIAKALFIEK